MTSPSRDGEARWLVFGLSGAIGGGLDLGRIRQPQANMSIYVSGIKEIKWLTEFPAIFHRLMCELEHVYLNTNEHNRAVVEVETRDARFVQQVRAKYPLHDYRRLARIAKIGPAPTIATCVRAMPPAASSGGCTYGYSGALYVDGIELHLPAARRFVAFVTRTGARPLRSPSF